MPLLDQENGEKKWQILVASWLSLNYPSGLSEGSIDRSSAETRFGQYFF